MFNLGLTSGGLLTAPLPPKASSATDPDLTVVKAIPGPLTFVFSGGAFAFLRAS